MSIPPEPIRAESQGALHRREFLQVMTHAAAVGSTLPAASAPAAPPSSPVIIDSHMHVWSSEPRKYPFAHPYQADFKQAPHAATLEMLIEDMDRHGCTHAVLVQVIYHGWDNSYLADCLTRFPRRLRAHGLIDPTHPKVAETLEFWVKERGLHGMRFSPIYYQGGKLGGDAWLDARPTHRLWEKAEELGAVFNFFIGPRQLPRLETMVRAHPEVKVIVDHFGQVDLAADDPEPDIRGLLALGRYDNVWVKVSELSSVSKSRSYPFADAYPFVKRVFEAFGADRLLFGTGYPGAARAAYHRPSLDQEIDLIRSKIPGWTPAEREKILGGNAARLWGFA